MSLSLRDWTNQWKSSFEKCLYILFSNNLIIGEEDIWNLNIFARNTRMHVPIRLQDSWHILLKKKLLTYAITRVVSMPNLDEYKGVITP